MKIAELFEAKDPRSADAAERVFGAAGSKVSGKKIIVKMSKSDYDRKLASYLDDLDDGREWGANYDTKLGAAVFVPEY